jgi:hypothetical protein
MTKDIVYNFYKIKKTIERTLWFKKIFKNYFLTGIVGITGCCVDFGVTLIFSTTDFLPFLTLYDINTDKNINIAANTAVTLIKKPLVPLLPKKESLEPLPPKAEPRSMPELGCKRIIKTSRAQITR